MGVWTFALVGLFPGEVWGTPLLDVTGTCPGVMTLTITGATPASDVFIVSGDRQGTTAIPSGPCAGTELGLADGLVVRATRTADGTGVVSLSPDVPALACRAWVQVLDVATCTVSGAVQLSTVPVLVGSFRVIDGPSWLNDPPVFSCLEVCAYQFGGSTAAYQCSTSDMLIDNRALASTWGDPTTCSPPGVPEDFKLEDPYNPGYNCLYIGCSVSAYVDDNCNSSHVNYCWK